MTATTSPLRLADALCADCGAPIVSADEPTHLDACTSCLGLHVDVACPDAADHDRPACPGTDAQLCRHPGCPNPANPTVICDHDHDHCCGQVSCCGFDDYELLP